MEAIKRGIMVGTFNNIRDEKNHEKPSLSNTKGICS